MKKEPYVNGWGLEIFPTDCKEYIADAAICYNFGAPKGQCICGYKWYEHELDVLPEEERKGAKYIQESMKLWVWKHIVDENGDPVEEWVSEEEYERREQDIQKNIDIIKASVKATVEQEQQCLKHIKSSPTKNS